MDHSSIDCLSIMETVPALPPDIFSISLSGQICRSSGKAILSILPMIDVSSLVMIPYYCSVLLDSTISRHLQFPPCEFFGLYFEKEAVRITGGRLPIYINENYCNSVLGTMAAMCGRNSTIHKGTRGYKRGRKVSRYIPGTGPAHSLLLKTPYYHYYSSL